MIKAKRKLESDIQKDIIKALEKENITTLKMRWVSVTGVFDLLLLLPYSKVAWVEVKRPGENLNPKQEWFERLLKRIHHDHAVCTSKEEALGFIRALGAKTSRVPKNRH